MTARAQPNAERLPSAMRAKLARLAADAVGPFGQAPLARLVAMHLPLFAKLRRLGASWAQIATLLADLGIAGTDGQITGDVLRATYARARTAVTTRNGAERNETQRAETTRNAAQRRDAETPSETKGIESKRNETMQPATHQTSEEQSATKPNAPECGTTERAARKRKASDESAATPKKAKSSIPQQSETPLNERRRNAPKRNVRGAPSATPVRTPPELRADSPFARIADLIDKPLRTR